MGTEEEQSQPSGAAAAVRNLLGPILGDFVARASINMASKRLGKSADAIRETDLPGLAGALRPALCTPVGVPAAELLVSQLCELGKR